MRIALLLPIALLVWAARPSSPLSDREFQQLMEAALAAASIPSEVQPHTTTICVARQLQPPFQATNAWIEAFEAAGKGVLQPSTGDVGADKSITTAMSSQDAVAHQTSISELPHKYLLVDAEALPSKCVIPHTFGQGPNWEREESAVVLSFTRPALANGYAFIEEYEECAGLCGTTFLRVFRKQNGKWTQVTRTILSVS